MQLVYSENMTVVGNSVFYEERIIEYNYVDLSDCLSIIILTGLLIRFIVTRMVNFCKPVNSNKPVTSDKPVNSDQPYRDSYAMPHDTPQQKLKKVENILGHVMSCKLGLECARYDCRLVKMQFYDDIFESDDSSISSEYDDSSVSSLSSYELTPTKMRTSEGRRNRSVSICSSTSSDDSDNRNYEKFLKSCKGCKSDCSCSSCDPDWTDVDESEADESDYSDEESSFDDEDEYESDDGDRSISATRKDEPIPETTDKKRDSKDKSYSDIYGYWPYMNTFKFSYLISMLYDSQDWTRPDEKMIKDLLRILNLETLKPKLLMEWFKNKRDEIRQKTNPTTTDAQRNDNETAKFITLFQLDKEQPYRRKLESYMKQNEDVQAVLEFLFKSKNWKSPTDHMLKALKVITGRKCRVLRNIFNRLAESEKESPVKSEAPDAEQSSDHHISHLTVKRSIDNKHQTQSTQAPSSAEKKENNTGSEGISNLSASPAQSTNAQETSNAQSTENAENWKATEKEDNNTGSERISNPFAPSVLIQSTNAQETSNASSTEVAGNWKREGCKILVFGIYAGLIFGVPRVYLLFMILSRILEQVFDLSKSFTDDVLAVLKAVIGRVCKVLRTIFNLLAEPEKKCPVKSYRILLYCAIGVVSFGLMYLDISSIYYTRKAHNVCERVPAIGKLCEYALKIFK